jgi:beta-glucosidase
LASQDEPNGIGGTRDLNGVQATYFPFGTTMGATFNQALLREAGELMGQETIAKGAHVLLRPCINVQRSPLGGRGFHLLPEDPVLAGLGAAAKGIKGIGGTRVAAPIKQTRMR